MFDWQEYQERAASIFRSMGLDAQVNAPIKGARATHDVDVWITGNLHGLEFNWVIECKAWKSKIPKEKVMALSSIVQDVGADRGILLSEVGFQSGAIDAVQNSNIFLMSIEEIQKTIQQSLKEHFAQSTSWKASQLKKEIFRRHKATGLYFSNASLILGKLAFLEYAVSEALEGPFPVVFTIDENNKRVTVKDWDEFVSKTNELFDGIETALKTE